MTFGTMVSTFLKNQEKVKVKKGTAEPSGWNHKVETSEANVERVDNSCVCTCVTCVSFTLTPCQS